VNPSRIKFGYTPLWFETKSKAVTEKSGHTKVVGHQFRETLEAFEGMMEGRLREAVLGTDSWQNTGDSRRSSRSFTPAILEGVPFDRN
jgi:hypothetical protein